MTKADERQRIEKARAQEYLAKRADTAELVHEIGAWFSALCGLPRDCSLAARPETTSLVEALRRKGTTDLAEAVEKIDQREGRIPPGRWILALLVGVAAANYHADDLASGRRSKWHLFELGWYGAWDVYLETLLALALGREDVASGIWNELERQIESVAQDPGLYAIVSFREEVRRSARAYLESPDLNQAWGGPMDGLVSLHAPYLFQMAQRLDAGRMLGILARAPHPAMISGCIDGSRPEELPDLIRQAPAAFDASGKVLSASMVAADIFKLTEDACRRVAWEKDGNGDILIADDQTELEARASELTAFTEVFTGALRSRPDAEELSWNWLERLVREGNGSGKWSLRYDGRQGFVIDPLMSLISSVASSLAWREDRHSWIGGAKGPWRIDRIGSAIAVMACTPDLPSSERESALLGFLLRYEPEYAQALDAMAGRRNAIARVGGSQILHATDPRAFVVDLWDRMRPVREKAWRRSSGERVGNDCGEVVALWAMSAMEQAPTASKHGLWVATASIICDAMSTDHAAAVWQFWPTALCRLCRSFRAVQESAGHPHGPSLLEWLLRPYIGPSETFFGMVLALHGAGTSLDEIDDALKHYGTSLPSLASRYLLHQGLRIERGYFDPGWVDRVRELAERADCGPGSVQS